jgi:UDP-galactopyranose mutase
VTSSKTVIVGAGATGLCAAMHLGSETLLLERESRVGGTCRSVRENGFTFDLAGHVMRSGDPYVDRLYTLLLRDNVRWHANGTTFGYPIRGGFQALMDAFLPYIQGEVRLNTPVERVSPDRGEVLLGDGSVIPYGALVSTMPLPQLVLSLGAEAPEEIREAAAGLRHVSMRCVNIGVGRESLTDKHWIEAREGSVFDRIFVQGNASAHCNPPGGFGLTCEIVYSDSKPLPAEGDELARRCVEDLRRLGVMAAEDPILAVCQTDLPYAHVVEEVGRRERVRLMRAWLLEREILLAGRFSEWEDYDSDRAFIAGRDAALHADTLNARLRGPCREERAPAPLWLWSPFATLEP